MPPNKIIKVLFSKNSYFGISTTGGYFCIHSYTSLLREKALSEIRKHQQYGSEVVIVSASMENWIKTGATPFT